MSQNQTAPTTTTCPKCGAYRDKERLISPPGGFVYCDHDWHAWHQFKSLPDAPKVILTDAEPSKPQETTKEETMNKQEKCPSCGCERVTILTNGCGCTDPFHIPGVVEGERQTGIYPSGSARNLAQES